MAQPRKDPICIAASQNDTENPATFIFLHGLGDDAEGWVNIAQQFQSAQKLPHLNWIFPNALENQEASTTAWYTPTSFSPIPVGKSSSGAPADTIDESSESQSIQSEILDSVEYICTLIDEEVKKGVAPKRIIIGGFSQGCAVALTTGLGSRYAAKTAAVVGLSGYMPNGQAIADAIHGFDESGGMRVFLAHGTRDMLIPMRIFRIAKEKVAELVGEEKLEAHEYQGMGHSTCGEEFRDLCGFLEMIVPA